MFKNAEILLLVGIVVLLPGCQDASKGPQTIQSAPPNALATHLKQCFSTKLSGGARLVVRDKVSVCRRDKDSNVVDQELTPRFQVGRSKGNKIGLRQIIAVKFDIAGETLESAKAPEALAIRAKAVEFLAKGCGPVLNGIFQRSGFESSHRFQLLQEGDQLASLTESAKSGLSADSFEFDDRPVAQRGAVRPPLVAQATPRRADEDEKSKRSYHMLLEMGLSEKTGLKLKDDVSDVESGTIVPGSPSDENETNRLQFCGQLAMRVAENYGLGSGRDCASMASSAEPPTKVDKRTSGGLMKPGKEIADLKTVKLAKREIHEILVPVCGDLKDKKGF